MKCKTIPTRDGNISVQVGGKTLHSTYAPLREAQRVLSRFSPERNATTLFVIGEGVPYLSGLIADTYPGLRVVAITYGDTGTTAPGVLRVSTGDSDTESTVADPMGTETDTVTKTARRAVRRILHPLDVGQVQAFLWPAAEDCVPDWTARVRAGIVLGIRDVQSELATVGSFGRLWLRNALRRTLQTESRREVSIAGDVILVAGGPSSDILLQKDGRFGGAIVIAASSASLLLSEAGITPAVLFHTDAGFWAQRYRRTTDEMTVRISNNKDPRAVQRGTVTALPLRASIRPGLPNSDDGALLYRHGWFGEALAPDTGTWPYIRESPTVAGTMLSFVTGYIPPATVNLVGFDLCSHDLSTHGSPHPNDRYIATVSSRLRPEVTIRAERSGYLTDLEPLQWSDGHAAFRTAALKTFAGAMHDGIAELADRHTAVHAVPSPVWETGAPPDSDTSPARRGEQHPGRIDAREIRRPDPATRKQHAGRVLAEWSDRLDDPASAPESRDILLHLAPVAAIRAVRHKTGYAAAVTKAREELHRLEELVHHV